MNTRIDYNLPSLEDKIGSDKIHQDAEGERLLGVVGVGIVEARL